MYRLTKEDIGKVIIFNNCILLKNPTDKNINTFIKKFNQYYSEQAYKSTYWGNEVIVVKDVCPTSFQLN